MKKKIILLFIASCLLVGCTDGDKTRRILSDQGYTDIEITGYKVFECGDDYTFHTGFKAKAPNTHKPVSGVVCSGVLKGASIKLD